MRVRIERDREIQLRRDLWEMQDAIDRYKDAADRGAFQTKVDSLGYPPDLQTLVDGVNVQGKKIPKVGLRSLRKESSFHPMLSSSVDNRLYFSVRRTAAFQYRT